MKRLASLILTATVWSGSIVAAAEPLAAPIAPSIPAPILQGEKLIPAEAGSGIPPARVPLRAAAAKYLHMPRMMPTPSPSQTWVNTSAPATPVRSVPATPVMPAYPLAAAPVTLSGRYAEPGGSAEAFGHKTHSCLEKIKGWFCFRAAPVRLGFTPTPFHFPLVGQFDCPSSACSGRGSCASGSCGGNGSRLGMGGCANPSSCRGTAGGCLNAPVVATPGFPGYRFAGAENPTLVPTGYVR